jgi:hypothetical protein
MMSLGENCEKGKNNNNNNQHYHRNMQRQSVSSQTMSLSTDGEFFHDDEYKKAGNCISCEVTKDF